MGFGFLLHLSYEPIHITGALSAASLHQLHALRSPLMGRISV
jgi:hypothetical protein